MAKLITLKKSPLVRARFLPTTIQDEVSGGGGGGTTQLLVPFDGSPLTADDQSVNALSATIGSAAALQSTTTRFGVTNDGAVEYTPLSAGDVNSVVSYPDIAALEPGSGAFTIEGHVRFKDLTNATQELVAKWSNATSSRSILFERSSGNLECTLYQSPGGGSDFFVAKVEAFSWVINTWYHFAVTRDDSDNLRLFIEGAQLGSPTVAAGTIFETAIPWTLGNMDVDATRALDGFLDNVRIKIGEALYTANFTPPSAPFSS